MNTFRVHFSDGRSIDVQADKPDDARTSKQALSYCRKMRVTITKTKLLKGA